MSPPARRWRTYAHPLHAGAGAVAPRGFYVTLYSGQLYAVRVGYHLVPCTGAAHERPAESDNCGVCAPLWGAVPVPLAYGTLADYHHMEPTP